MEPRTLLAQIRADLKAAAEGGNALNAVGVDAYLARVDSLLEKDAAGLDQYSTERMKAAEALRLAQYQHELEHVRVMSLELYKSTGASGQAAMQAALLINGAAATALLAFAGHLLSMSPPPIRISAVASPMRLFVFGVGFAAVAFGLTYLTQYLAMLRPRKPRASTICNILAIAFVVFSYVAFFVAAWNTGKLLCAI